jgi:hypothetical protein
MGSQARTLGFLLFLMAHQSFGVNIEFNSEENSSKDNSEIIK